MEISSRPSMQNPACDPSEAMPPPPPPLPPKTSPRCVSPQVQSFNSAPISRLINFAFSDHYKNIVSFYKPVNTIKQQGPQCGIVALAMASQLLSERPCNVEDIMSEAKRSNYTKLGEMFSASNIASLAESLLGCRATVVTDLMSCRREILSCICGDGTVLIPYDASKNHEPCLNNGKNAHWAILNGVCLALSEDLSGSEYEPWVDDPRVFTLSSGKRAERFLEDPVQTCVYAHHGKSSYMALWDFNAVLLSNMNLHEVTQKYGLENLLLPSVEDALSGLRDKAVLLEKA